MIFLRKNSEHGVALITALLILVITATTATYLLQQLNLSMRRSGNIINGNQAYLYALGAESLAIIALNEDFKKNKIEWHEDDWTLELNVPVEDGAGYIYGKVTDLQTRFNVNNLIGKQNYAAIEQFGRLLTLFGIESEVTNAVVDWLDSDHDAQGMYGAESDYYLGLEQPYRCANREITSVSELRLVRGLDTAKRFDELAQHLTALPNGTLINVNLAGYELHYAITGNAQNAAEAVRHSESMLEQQIDPNFQQQEVADEDFDNNAESIPKRPNIPITADSTEPYENVGDYIAKNNLQNDAKNNKVHQQTLSVDSEYFLVEGETELDRARATIKSVLRRDKNGKIEILMRTQGDF